MEHREEQGIITLHESVRFRRHRDVEMMDAPFVEQQIKVLKYREVLRARFRGEREAGRHTSAEIFRQVVALVIVLGNCAIGTDRAAVTGLSRSAFDQATRRG
ncbi:MAG TPA: hypothetical protein VIJ63_04250 [Roseiarcus sp.]